MPFILNIHAFEEALSVDLEGWIECILKSHGSCVTCNIYGMQIIGCEMITSLLEILLKYAGNMKFT